MITDIHRIVVKRNNVEIKTNTLILTFNTPQIPDYLKNCYLNIPVTQYVPNPIRCYKYQRFGHVTGRCKHSETCARCSETGHKDDTCTKEYKCINCGEKHASYNKKCSHYKREFDIQHIRVSKNVYFFEARTIYKTPHGQRVMNYVGATKAPTQCISVYIHRPMCRGLWLSLIHGSNVLLLCYKQASSIRLTISGHYHSCGGCESCGPT